MRSDRKCPLHWRHNGRNGVLNKQPHDCLLKRLFRRRSKKTSKLRVTGLCAGNSPVAGEFRAQMASNAENVSIWWRHHAPINTRFYCEDTVLTSKTLLFSPFLWILWISKTGSLMKRHFFKCPTRFREISCHLCELVNATRLISTTTMCVFTGSFEPKPRGRWFMRHMINQCFTFSRDLSS